MASEIERIISNLTGPLTPIRDLAARRLSARCTVDPKSGALLLDHRPKVAPEAYALVLYPGMNEKNLDRYCEIQADALNRGIAIPAGYRSVLSGLNGASIFRGNLFGVPRSMLVNPPLLDRSTRQPLNLGSANSYWRLEYKVKPDLFFFGAGSYSHTENLGYFWADGDQVETYLPGGKLVEAFPSLRSFLVEELARLESNFPEYERRQEELQREFTAEQERSRIVTGSKRSRRPSK